MGKFEKQQEKKQEQKEKEKTRCEALGKFDYHRIETAKLVFAALVLGGMFPYFRRMIVTLLQTQIHTL